MNELGYNDMGHLTDELLTHLLRPVPGTALPWWPVMNQAIGGLRSGELTLICAPTGTGKTQLLANIACQLMEQRTPTFIAPVETGAVDFMARMVSVLDRYDYNTGEPQSAEVVRSMQEKHFPAIKAAGFKFGNYESRVEIEEMKTMLIYQTQLYGMKVALLDNLNFFLKVTRSQDQILEMDEAVRVFGQVAKQMNIHIILVCHPKKTDGGRVTSEFDLKGSSSLVQEAWNVGLWNRPPTEDPRPVTDRELVFRKMRRRGSVVGQAFWFRYVGGRFIESTQTQQPKPFSQNRKPGYKHEYL